MGKPLAGDVVVLPFPQTNLQTGKRRPALVVADLAGDDLILCQITSRARSDGYSVPLSAGDCEQGRLTVDSFIRPNRQLLCPALDPPPAAAPPRPATCRGPVRSLAPTRLSGCSAAAAWARC